MEDFHYRVITCWLAGWLFCWCICSFVSALFRSLVRSFIRWCICSFIHLLIRSLVPPQAWPLCRAFVHRKTVSISEYITRKIRIFAAMALDRTADRLWSTSFLDSFIFMTLSVVERRGSAISSPLFAFSGSSPFSRPLCISGFTLWSYFSLCSLCRSLADWLIHL